MEDYSLLCPICIETFRSPKLFKECGHSFCEQCLFTYVTALKDKGELGSTFPCPVCRQEVPAPSDKGISMAWVQTFPANADLIEKLSKIQTKKDDDIEKEPMIFCDPCSVENEQNRAIEFCTSCKEHLCKDCISAHRKFKAFHGHKLSEITNVKQFNKLTDLAVTTCEKHTDRDIEVYCPRHDIYCCLKCFKADHKDCSGLKEICEMETTAQTMMNAFKNKLEIAEKHIENLVLSIKTIISDGHKNGQKVIDRLKDYQDKIIAALDDMIKNAVSQTKQQLLVLEDEVAGEIVEIEKIKVRCQNAKETIDIVSDYGLPVHKVLMQKSISKKYFKIEKDINTEDDKMQALDFGFEGQHRLQQLYSELMKCKEEPVIVVRQPSELLKYDDVVNRTTLNTSIKTQGHYIQLIGMCSPSFTGLTKINNTLLFLCDNCRSRCCGYVCLYDIENNKKMKLKMNKPFSAAVLKYNTSNVAVSVPGDKKIHIVSIKGETLAIENTFTCDKQPYSLISLDNGLVGVTWNNPTSFDMVDMSGNEIKTVKTFTMDSTGRKFKYFEYVAVDELRSHIVQPCNKGNAVYCFDFSGNPVFEYKDQELGSPCGVDIDSNGLIYVCSSDNNNIHVLAPSGRKLKIFKDIGIGLKAICFDKIGEKIWFAGDTYNPFENSNIHLVSFTG